MWQALAVVCGAVYKISRSFQRAIPPVPEAFWYLILPQADI